MADSLIGDVSDTAFWIAHYRAVETKRADALFHDPLAGVLAGERGEKIVRSMPMGFWTSWTVVMRTCIIDDFIRWAIKKRAMGLPPLMRVLFAIQSAFSSPARREAFRKLAGYVILERVQGAGADS
jgi:hypothetical protein